MRPLIIIVKTHLKFESFPCFLPQQVLSADLMNPILLSRSLVISLALVQILECLSLWISLEVRALRTFGRGGFR